MNDEKIIKLIDDIVKLRKFAEKGSPLNLHVLRKIDKLVAHIKLNY